MYKARNKNSACCDFVLKTSPIYPTNVIRIQRELSILKNFNSSYFPNSIHSLYISDEQIAYFIDNYDPKTKIKEIEEIKSFNIRPLFITIEEFIAHEKWDDCNKIFVNNEDIFINFLKNLFNALNMLWSNKIIHRDLKPDNILIQSDLTPVIIDLGIAKSLREGTNVITHYLVSSPCTPQFAAPEQIFNNKADVTYKSDQFSIGVISFWAMTGIFPFGLIQDIGYEQFSQNISGNKIVNIKDHNEYISDDLCEFILKLLSVNPYQRYRNYESIFDHLNAIGDRK